MVPEYSYFVIALCRLFDNHLSAFQSPRVSSEHSRDGDDTSNDGGSPRKQGMGEDEEIMLLSPAATTASSTDSRPSSPEPDQTVGEVVKGSLG